MFVNTMEEISDATFSRVFAPHLDIWKFPQHIVEANTTSTHAIYLMCTTCRRFSNKCKQPKILLTNSLPLPQIRHLTFAGMTHIINIIAKIIELSTHRDSLPRNSSGTHTTSTHLCAPKLVHFDIMCCFCLKLRFVHGVFS